ncbi:MAG TPA: ABC transporter permease [Firmicutes bacterium]|nr:ABC transporter permease [Bacillota bacterium]
MRREPNVSRVPVSVRRVPGTFYILIIMISLASITIPGFGTVSNLLNILLQGSFLAIVACGATLAIISSGIDLSVGTVLSLSGVVTGLALHAGIPIALAILSGVLTGLICGIITGSLVAFVGLEPFIATFGMMSMAQGLGLVLSNGASIPGFQESFRWFGEGVVWKVPVPLIIALVIVACIWWLLRHTRLGLYIYAIGGSEEVAGWSGIEVGRCKLALYSISGCLAGIAGVLLAARMNSGHPTVGVGWEMDAIASVVIGGTPLTGGRGGVIGTMVGVAIVSVLRNILNMLRLSSPWQITLIGAIVVIAIGLDILLRRWRLALEG